MSWSSGILLALAALGGGALNAIAGGGSFLTFPALVFAGADPIHANATSTLALWPGTFASALAYRGELLAERSRAPLLLATSVVGGAAGAVLLIFTPATVFVRVVPYLLLLSTAIFAFGDRLRGRAQPSGRREPRPWVGVGIQLLVAVYGGYFGGGIGIMMLAAFALMGMRSIHRMNALKVLLTLGINGVAVAAFAVARILEVVPAGIMAAGAVLGGYGGAALALRLDPRWIRGTVILLGLGMSAYFFARQP